MTTYTTNMQGGTPLQTILTYMSAPFRAVGRGLIALAEADSRMREVNRLQNLSDAELAAKGTTRQDEVRRIFAASGAV